MHTFKFKSVFNFGVLHGSALLFMALSFLTRPVLHLLPKNKNIWLFGSGSGRDFSDNSKYLYLYVKTSHPEIRPIWLSQNHLVVKELIEKGYEAYSTYSLRGFIYSLKAECVFMSSGILDINPITRWRAIKIQLWHGIPLKKIGNDTDLKSKQSYKDTNVLIRQANYFARQITSYEERCFDYIVACSQEQRDKLSSAFKIDLNKVMITGYPRNDALFNCESHMGKSIDYLNDIRKKIAFKRLIVYLPTFRDSKIGNEGLFEKYGFSFQEIEKALKKLDAILIMKAHRLDNDILQTNNIRSSRIYNPSHSELSDIYPVLKEANILITDYSSVYFDFLLLNRPIIFTPFDLNEYVKNDRELYYEYDEVTPGPKANNWAEVLLALQQEIDKDNWKAQRNLILKRFHKYKDGMSSERVFNSVQNIINAQRKIKL